MSKASTGSSAAHLTGFTLSANMLRALGDHFRARRNARQLVRFNDFMLRDIGLTRADVMSMTRGERLRRD